MRMINRVRGWPREFQLLWALLLFSYLLRVALIMRGGPLSWPDDPRYFRVTTALDHVRQGQFGEAVDLAVSSPDHTFFTFVSLVPELTRMSTRWIAEAVFGSSASMISVAAGLLAMMSVANIGLVYAVMRKVGNNARAAFLAALFLACATSTLHLTRHLVPYEAALTFALLGLLYVVDDRPRFVVAFLCGLFAFLTFFTYNAFWITAAVLPLIYVGRAERAREAMWRTGGATVGFASVPLLFSGISLVRGSPPFTAGLRNFSQTVTAGDFAEGWSLPWAYFWHAEHAILALWLVSLALIAWRVVKGDPMAKRIAWVTLVPLAVQYLSFVLGSNVFHRLVVAARTTNQMVPFFCLAAGYALAHVWFNYRISLPLVTILLLVALGNFRQVSRITFPFEFRERALATASRQPAEVVTLGCQLWHSRIDGFQFFDDHFTAQTDAAAPAGRFVLVNAGVLLFPITVPKPLPRGHTVLRAKNMLSYRPYQYEGFTPAARTLLRKTDISMRLIDRGTLP